MVWKARPRRGAGRVSVSTPFFRGRTPLATSLSTPRYQNVRVLIRVPRSPLSDASYRCNRAASHSDRRRFQQELDLIQIAARGLRIEIEFPERLDLVSRIQPGSAPACTIDVEIPPRPRTVAVRDLCDAFVSRPHHKLMTRASGSEAARRSFSAASGARHILARLSRLARVATTPTVMEL